MKSILTLLALAFPALMVVESARASDSNVQLNYKNADLRGVLVETAKKFHKNFIIAPEVNGKVTISTPVPVSPEDAYQAVMAALALNGFTPVQHGPYIKICRAQIAFRSDVPIFDDVLPPDLGEQMATLIFHLKKHSAKEVYQTFAPLFNSRFGEIKAYDKTNIILVSDYVSNLKRIKKLVDDMEGPAEGSSLATAGNSAPHETLAKMADPLGLPVDPDLEAADKKAAAKDAVALNYKVSEIVPALLAESKRFNKNFIIDPNINGKITILTNVPVASDDAYEALMVAVEMNGFTPVADGKYTRVVRAQSAQRENIPTYVDAIPFGIHEGMATAIFHLKNVKNQDVYNVFGSTLSSRMGESRVADDGNALIASDYVSSLRRMKKIIDEVDQPTGARPGAAVSASGPSTHE